MFVFLCACLFPHYIFFKWATAATETHSYSQTETNSTCYPWRGLAAPCLLPASWYLIWFSGAGTRVILSGKHIWSPRSSFFPLTIHPFTPLPRCPPAVQLSPLLSTVQSNPMNCPCLKLKRYTLHLLRYSLQSVKQVCMDVMNCQPVFGMTIHMATGVPMSLPLCDCIVCVHVEWAGGFTQLQVTVTHCQCVCLCVFSGTHVCVPVYDSETTIGLVWITEIQPSYTEIHLIQHRVKRKKILCTPF